MADLDNFVEVSIATDAPPIGTRGFGVPLFIDEVSSLPSSRVKTFEDTTAAEEDSDLTDYQEEAVAAAFSQDPKPSEVKVAFKEETEEDWDEALDEAVQEDSDFYAVCAGVRTNDNDEQKSVADWVLANERVGILQTSDEDVFDDQADTDILSVLEDEENDRCAVLAYKAGSDPDNEAADAAWVAQNIAVDPDQDTTTWKYSTLAGISTDNLTTDEKNAVLSLSGNVYGTFFGQGSTAGGTLADGTFLDERISADWVKARTREAFAQAFLDYSNRGSKIPYTNEGFQVFEQAARDVLLLGEDVGHFVENTHFVDMPDRSEVTQSDVDNRILRFEFGAALSGAVHELVVDGTISVDLDLIDQLAS